jgi:hypothetical protein
MRCISYSLSPIIQYSEARTVVRKLSLISFITHMPEKVNKVIEEPYFYLILMTRRLSYLTIIPVLRLKYNGTHVFWTNKIVELSVLLNIK